MNLNKMAQGKRQYGRSRTTKEHVKRFFECWTLLDFCLNAIGVIAAICAGITEPLLNIPFGNITTTFSNGQDQSQYTSQTNKEVLYFLYLGEYLDAASTGSDADGLRLH